MALPHLINDILFFYSFEKPSSRRYEEKHRLLAMIPDCMPLKSGSFLKPNEQVSLLWFVVIVEFPYAIGSCCPCFNSEINTKVLRVGMELRKETLPLNTGSCFYQLQGLQYHMQ